MYCTFVTHDCYMHACFFQHPQAFSFHTLLQVTEVKPSDKDPEPKVWCLAEKLGQFNGAVGTGRPGAKPCDWVTQPLLPRTKPPKSRAQRTKVTQKQNLHRNHNSVNRRFVSQNFSHTTQAFLQLTRTSTWHPLRLRRCPKSKDKEFGPKRLFTTKQRYVSWRPLAQRRFL